MTLIDVSRGGTFVNGKPVGRSSGTVLEDDDIISLVTALSEGEAVSCELRAWRVEIKPETETSEILKADEGEPPVEEIFYSPAEFSPEEIEVLESLANLKISEEQWHGPSSPC